MECKAESNTRFERFLGSMRKAGDFDDERYSVWRDDGASYSEILNE